jgi:ribosomal protein S12 methylthiotransferase accessory factor
VIQVARAGGDGTRACLDGLASPLGVVSLPRHLLSFRGLSRVHVQVASAGSGWPGRGILDGHESVSGCGRVLDDPELARTVAIAEAAERYAGANFHEVAVWNRIADLHEPTIDTSRLPRCSPREYAHPRCPLVPFDSRASIRWVKGVDLISSAETWVPAVMVCYGLEPTPPERFWYQISTGDAAHTDPQRALIGAILELIERDIIAILWLQRLPLPPVAPDILSDRCRYLLEWSEHHFLQTYLFDATTDLRVPTVYCLQVAEHDKVARQIVGCGTDITMTKAAEKALLEALMARPVFHNDEPMPTDFADFHTCMHGARYMARAEHAAAFDFLVGDGATRKPSDGCPDLPEDVDAALGHVLGLLSAKEMQVIAVDRTSRELADIGLTVVTVVIPDLQPMSLLPLAQFRGHSRLYAAPQAMGYRSLPEEDLNQWPQPFA